MITYDFANLPDFFMGKVYAFEEHSGDRRSIFLLSISIIISKYFLGLLCADIV